MVGDGNHTLEWMRRLDRRFSVLSDRLDQVERRVSRVEDGSATISGDMSSLHQMDYSLSKRIERLEERFETVGTSNG